MKLLSKWSIGLLMLSVGTANAMNLPDRQGDRPRTTNSVPHVQIGVTSQPALSQVLLQRVAEFPGVTLGATRVSLPGATGFQLDAGLDLANPDAIVGGREFAHVHPDGSLHASLSPEIARQAVDTGWAVMHPWAAQRPGWEGFVMIYTPQNTEQLNVVYELVQRSYTYVTGQTLPQ